MKPSANPPPTVSVLISSFNSAIFLPATLDSILSQTLSDIEIIVVDDGSTDETKSVMRCYEGRVRYFHQENSGGPARPRNVGIQMARGEFISIFDSDDLMAPTKLERSVELARQLPEVGLIFTDFIQFDDRGDCATTHLSTYTRFLQLPRTPIGAASFRIASNDAFESLFFENYIGTSSVLIPRRILTAVGPFDEEVTHGGLDDRDMWLRIARNHDLGFCDFVGHKYRVREGGVSRRTIAVATTRMKVLSRHSAYAKSPTVHNQVVVALENCLGTIAYAHRQAGNHREAFNAHVRMFRNRPSLVTAFGILKTFAFTAIAGVRRFLARPRAR